jgi:hypothetical protein
MKGRAERFVTENTNKTMRVAEVASTTVKV